MEILLKEITKDNYQECMALEVLESQKNFVATNAFSLAQAAYESELFPLAIYDGSLMVGFILYDWDQELQAWSFSRFMIDHKYQNRGYGRQALTVFLAFFKENHPTENLYTSAEVDNVAALSLYQAMGFEDVGIFEYTYNGHRYEEMRLKLSAK